MIPCVSDFIDMYNSYYQPMSNNWKIGLCEGSVSVYCYACWCRCCAYADLAEATGALPLGTTRTPGNACCSYVVAPTWARFNLMMDVLTRIRQPKGIRVGFND